MHEKRKAAFRGSELGPCFEACALAGPRVRRLRQRTGDPVAQSYAEWLPAGCLIE